MIVKEINFNQIVPIEIQIKVKIIHYIQDHEKYMNALQKNALLKYIENDYLLELMADSLITDKRPPDGRVGKAIDRTIDHIVAVFNDRGE